MWPWTPLIQAKLVGSPPLVCMPSVQFHTAAFPLQLVTPTCAPPRGPALKEACLLSAELPGRQRGFHLCEQDFLPHQQKLLAGEETGS